MNLNQTDFDLWWDQYPHKIGKKAALRSYERARKEASAQTLLDGVKAYIRHKPRERSWCNPATWLNQGRWDDEPATAGGDKLTSGLQSLSHAELVSLYHWTQNADCDNAHLPMGSDRMRSLMRKNLNDWQNQSRDQLRLAQ